MSDRGWTIAGTVIGGVSLIITVLVIVLGIAKRRQVKVFGSIKTVNIMRSLDLKHENPSADETNLSSLHLLMFVEVAADKEVTLSNWTLQVQAGKNSYSTRLAEVTRLPDEKMKQDFHDSTLRHLSKNLPPDFKSLPAQVLDGVDSKGQRGWIQFDVYSVDDVLKTHQINLTLTATDSFGHEHVIRRTLTDEERADLM